MQEAQLASNPVCANEVPPVEAPAPVTHEAQAEFVESQAYPVSQAVQAIALLSISHVLQLGTVKVYFSAVPPVLVPVPAVHEAQALFMSSQPYPVVQWVQVKTVVPEPTVHVSQLGTIPVYAVPVPAAIRPVVHEIQILLVES